MHWGWFLLIGGLIIGIIIGVIHEAIENSKNSSKNGYVKDTSFTRQKSFVLVNLYEHNADAFTEGFFFHENRLYESTGSFGHSYLRQMHTVSNQTILQEYQLPSNFFGEGIAILDNYIYMLTYKARMGFIFDKHSFELKGNFTYQTKTGEGWGMTTDGTNLIVSDGSASIFIWQPLLPKNGIFDHSIEMKVLDTLTIYHHGNPLNNINELEFIEGDILANVWFTNKIFRINLEKAQVVDVIDLTELVGRVSSLEKLKGNRLHNAVMNGIAYNPKNRHVYITGKLWNKIFELELPYLTNLHSSTN